MPPGAAACEGESRQVGQVGQCREVFDVVARKIDSRQSGQAGEGRDVADDMHFKWGGVIRPRPRRVCPRRVQLTAGAEKNEHFCKRCTTHYTAELSLRE